MRRHVTQALTALFGVAALSAGAGAQILYDKIEIKTDKLAPNLYMLSGSENVDPGHPDGAGGRIGVLAGPDGVFMVDSQYQQIGDRVLAAVRTIDPGPIRFLVNTHIHGDHTAGNATFAKLGAVLLAREELREGMARQPATTPPAPPRDPARLPVVTYGMGDPVRFRMNGETIELIPVRAAHTGGDTIVRFVNADVIMIGDFYRNFGYPFIDTNNGGSLKGALEGLDFTMQIAGPNTRLIPGHGTYIKRDDIVPYRDMMLDVQRKVQQLIAQGKTLQEVLAAKVTAPYDAKVPGGLLPVGGSASSADRFVSMVYAQLKSAQEELEISRWIGCKITAGGSWPRPAHRCSGRLTCSRLTALRAGGRPSSATRDRNFATRLNLALLRRSLP